MLTHQCKVCKRNLKVCCFIKNKTYRLGISNQCKDCKAQYDRYYREKFKDILRAKRRDYRILNRDIINAKQRSPERLHKRRLWRKEKMKNPRYALKEKLNSRIRTSINQHLKGIKNRRNWSSILGYSWDDLKQHLEKKFSVGMSWKKFLDGEIHIDHIRPIDSFDFKSVKDENFRKCWDLSNLQPLWKEDNLLKGNKYNIQKEDR